MDKREFRKEVIQARKNLNNDLVTFNSELISNKLLSMDEIKSAHTIMLYLDFNNEVMTNDLINSLLELNKNVVIPITIKEDRKLIPSLIKDLQNELQIGTYGIREPKEEFYRPVDMNDIDVVIVPAVAYDEHCYRLGYGGGFYDRFLENLRPDASTIGIAFEMQIFTHIPKEPHDAQLDFIITEKRIIKRES